jgi:hypothetical protein
MKYFIVVIGLFTLSGCLKDDIRYTLKKSYQLGCLEGTLYIHDNIQKLSYDQRQRMSKYCEENKEKMGDYVQ